MGLIGRKILFRQRLNCAPTMQSYNQFKIRWDTLDEDALQCGSNVTSCIPVSSDTKNAMNCAAESASISLMLAGRTRILFPCSANQNQGFEKNSKGGCLQGCRFSKLPHGNSEFVVRSGNDHNLGGYKLLYRVTKSLGM